MRLVCVILFAPPSLHRRRLLHHTALAALFATFRPCDDRMLDRATVSKDTLQNRRILPTFVSRIAV